MPPHSGKNGPCLLEAPWSGADDAPGSDGSSDEEQEASTGTTARSATANALAWRLPRRARGSPFTPATVAAARSPNHQHVL
ncbi:hypothetical protein GCM10023114_14840 [Mycolicibacterium sediminis]|uniref:Uncharacterized protein n=1 Tax=Mycolicibacterium sediminis TaxID=1286180 RepID=A0A7I7QXV2_9MYCO|nr:hypothetical protein MSEDJ_52700 [Mycolicibacterium sediminis]